MPVFVSPLRRVAKLTVAVAVAGLSLAPIAAHARSGIELVAPRQGLVIGEVGATFEADVPVGEDGHARGFVNFLRRDGTAIELVPSYGITLQRGAKSGSIPPGERDNVGVIPVLRSRIGSPTDTDDFVVATVRNSYAEVGCDIWDLIGSDERGGTRVVPFDAQTLRTRIERVCQPADLGEFDTAVTIRSTPQTVDPTDGSNPLKFSANVHVERDLSAHGLVHSPLSEGGGFYRTVFGAAIAHPEHDFEVYVFSVYANPQVFPPGIDSLPAAIRPSEVDPEDQICDLINGESPEPSVPHAAAAVAETDLRFTPEPPR